MKPVDPQLVRRIAPVRRLITTSAALAVIGAAATVVQALMLARLLASALDAAAANSSATAATLLVLAAAIGVRAATAWSVEQTAGRAAGSAVRQLRLAALAALAERGYRLRRTESASTLLPVLGAGLDGLHGYLGRYLPALVQAALMPAAVLAVLLAADPISAVIVVLTLPLVPLFMALIGWYTAAATRRSLATVGRMAGRFADVVTGLPALVVFDRVRSAAHAVGKAAQAHRLASAATLRIAFLSSMVLEMTATLSVALVAVTCGLRLVSGSMTIEVALIVLLLAPEAYLPLRAVGARFHAAADGVAAVGEVLRMLDVGEPATGHRTDTAPVPRLRLRRVGLRFPDGRRVDLGTHEFPARAVTVLCGASGAGKTTALTLLAGLDHPDSGAVTVSGQDGTEIDLTEIDARHWRGRVGWCGQQIALTPGTLRENLTGGKPVAAARFDAVIDACRLTELIADLPAGVDTHVGQGGRGLSTGQRRRLGLARALLSAAPVLLLDEPTQGLDAATEAQLVRAVRPLLAGRTVVLSTHRPAVLELADTVIDLDAGAGVAGAGVAGAPDVPDLPDVPGAPDVPDLPDVPGVVGDPSLEPATRVGSR